MSHNPNNYMDGVPVKISEKYKPPPKVSIPQSIIQRIKSDDVLSTQLDYDFSLERNVLTKIEQWKKVREIEKENRRERLRKNEIERNRQIEEKQKQLLTAVSYPNAEDLSSDEDEEENAIEEATNNPAVGQFNLPQKNFDTILTPTVVPDSYNQVNISSVKQNLSKFNYSEFENDTSSPFDNVELKTMNDLVILAQVLTDTQLHSNTDLNVEDESPNENIKNSNDSYQNIETFNTNSNVIIRTPVIYPPQCSQNANNFPSYEQPSQQNVNNMNGYIKNDYYYCNNLPSNQNYNNYVYNSYIGPEQNHVGYLHYNQPILNQPEYTNLNTVDTSTYTIPIEPLPVKNKSKSVPDILKELNDEIRDSELRRARNYSQTPPVLESKKSHSKPRQDPPTPESFLRLSPSSQALVQDISQMGFPLERVSKIAEKLGNDDKKIFEHLLPLSELLDLGFDESKISEALLKFDNNKEKALDFLIS